MMEKIDKGSLILGVIGGAAGVLVVQHYGKKVVEWYEKKEIEKYEKLGESFGKVIEKYLEKRK